MNSSESQKEIVNKTIIFVKETLKHAESGHDFFHIQRVWKNSKKIALIELEDNKLDVDLIVVELAALLHDIADHKFHNGDETIGPEVAREFLNSIEVEKSVVDAVCEIIATISFKGSTEVNEMKTIEGKIVQDADRLDAIGAIGIARAFSYGGFKNRVMYDPEEQPNMNMDWKQYKNNKGTTVNHFYEKLLLIKDRLNTKAGKSVAEKRHQYMVEFLDNFYDEWNAN